MFNDQALQSTWASIWPNLAWLCTAALSGWVWAITASDLDTCGHLVRPMLALSILEILVLALLLPLRNRHHSIQAMNKMVPFLAFAILALIGVIITFVYSFLLLAAVVDSWPTPSTCQSGRVSHTSYLVLAYGFAFACLYLWGVLHVAYSRIVFLKPTPRAYDDSGIVRWAATPDRMWIPTIFYRYHDPTPDTFTILYSHGNAVDLTDMQYTMTMVCHSLKCHVLGYEYIGYGPAIGPVSEANCYASLHAAYNTLRTTYGIPANRIVLWGRSLGTGVTVHCAAQLGSGIAGVILESPLRSIMRTILNYSCPTLCCDMFASQDKVHHITVPVHIEHGITDVVVPTSHGRHLVNALGHRAWEPRWWPNIGHNDMPRIWMAGEAEARKERSGTHDKMTKDQMHAEQRRTMRDFLLHLLEYQRLAAATAGTTTVVTTTTTSAPAAAAAAAAAASSTSAAAATAAPVPMTTTTTTTITTTTVNSSAGTPLALAGSVEGGYVVPEVVPLPVSPSSSHVGDREMSSLSDEHKSGGGGQGGSGVVGLQVHADPAHVHIHMPASPSAASASQSQSASFAPMAVGTSPSLAVVRV